MTERHRGEPRLRSNPVSASRKLSATGDSSQGAEWRESRNGFPEGAGYRRAGDGGREAEIAAKVASIREQAARNALAAGADPGEVRDYLASPAARRDRDAAYPRLRR